MAVRPDEALKLSSQTPGIKLDFWCSVWVLTCIPHWAAALDERATSSPEEA